MKDTLDIGQQEKIVDKFGVWGLQLTFKKIT